MRAVTKALLIWYLLDLFFSLIIGVLENEWSLAIYLSIWTVICLICYKVKPKFFVVSAFLLAVLEETIVYFLGGGLQGTATSLLDDYAGSLPVFLMFILGWWIVLKNYYVDDETLYFHAGLHGFLFEITIPGHLLSLLTVFLFGGSAFFIYASIILIPSKPLTIKDGRKATTHHKIIFWILIAISMILGGIIATILRTYSKI